ncbi:MAG: SigE family RNA polymerase sigma factor [Nocardioides sp.]
MHHRNDAPSTYLQGVADAAEGPVRMDDAEGEYTWFFRAEFAGVARAAYLVVHDRQRAEDLAQEAFTQLYVHWRKVSRYERPDAWVRRVAIRAGVRDARRERVRPALERSGSPSPSYDDPLDLDLVRAIRALPPRQRAAVTLFYLEDRPTNEVADILGCSESTVKVHLFKARRRLSELLGEEIHDAP